MTSVYLRDLLDRLLIAIFIFSTLSRPTFQQFSSILNTYHPSIETQFSWSFSRWLPKSCVQVFWTHIIPPLKHTSHGHFLGDSQSQTVSYMTKPQDCILIACILSLCFFIKSSQFHPCSASPSGTKALYASSSTPEAFSFPWQYVQTLTYL